MLCLMGRQGLLLGLLGLLPFTGCLSGCALEKAINSQQAIAFKIIDKSNIVESKLAGNIEAHSPAYRFQGFAGTGVYIDGVLTVERVDVTATAEARGFGGDGESPEVRQQILDLLKNPTTKDQILDLLKKNPPAAVGGDSTPK